MSSIAIEPFYLHGDNGPLFCLYTAPRAGPVRASLLYLHPFAEEMHKSRRMVALQARHLAARGFQVLQVDLTGCGDSWGGFGDAQWALWRADAWRALEWLRQRATGNACILWGLRLGATLAIDLATRTSDIAGLLLWQPVTNGELFLSQFLRIKLASEMLSAGSAQTGTKQLREQLKRGEPVEVGGYQIAPPLAEAISALNLPDMAPTQCVEWIEVVPDPQAPIAPAVERVVQSWGAQDCTVSPIQIAGEPFWISQEITVCPTLLDATCSACERMLR